MEGSMDRDIRVLSLAALAAAILMPVTGAAQAPPKSTAPVAPQTEQLDPKACTQDRETVGAGGDLGSQDPQGKSLSDRLTRSDGVICPPSHVDPEITQPTPPGGPMPVIPPPGSPGGDPSVQPK
jgi:hypothetical protein